MPRIPRPTEGAPVEPPPVLPQVKPVPRWIGPVFAVLAAITIPWTVYLAITLPEHVQTRNYRVGWVGFDLGLILLLLLTAQLAYRGSGTWLWPRRRPRPRWSSTPGSTS